MIPILFWSIVALIVYTYLLFPLLVLVRGRFRRRPYRCGDATPTVSAIVVVHNEESVIGAKLRSLLSQDYPAHKLEVLVASDGSNDATNHVVSGFAPRGVALLPLPRRGKIPALNTAVKSATGEVLVFSDANSIFAPGAIRALVRPLADPRIGGVAGDQRYLDDCAKGNAGERTYWNFDRMLKKAQSAAGSVTSATGAIYAIRRSLFRPVPPAVTDDFAISTGVIAQGYRLVFAPEAVAYEPAAAESGVEFGRKARVITRGLRGLLVRRTLLNPFRYGFYAIQLFSHKVLRRLVVIPLLLLLPLSVLLWTHGLPYQIALLGQIGLYGCGLLGMMLEGTPWGRGKVLALPLFFCLVNWASLVAAVNVVRGHRIDLWEPQREKPAKDVAAEPATVVVPVEREA